MPAGRDTSRPTHEDRQRRTGSAKAPCDLEPGHVGQADVEDEDIDRGPGVDDIEAVRPGRDELDDVPVRGEQALELSAQAGIVFDQEKVHRPEGCSTGF